MEKFMSDMTMEDWKEFLKARLEQESGKNESEVNDVFERLAQSYPDNPHVQASLAFALERQGKTEESITQRVGAKYSSLARSLSGNNDSPELWSKELQELLDGLKSASKGKGVPGTFKAW